jgi:hypothetical protein
MVERDNQPNVFRDDRRIWHVRIESEHPNSLFRRTLAEIRRIERAGGVVWSVHVEHDVDGDGKWKADLYGLW